MAISTIYDVRVRLLMTDKGSKALLTTLRRLRGVRAEMEGVGRASSGLGASLGRLASLAVGAFGIHKAADALIGFNSTLEQGRITMAGMMSQATGDAFTDSMKRATDLVAKLQIRARDSIGTTEDMVNMAAMITRPISAAGLGMKDLENFTASAVVAAKAFNIAPDMAARDIEAALMGQLRSVDRFSRALLESKAFGGKYVGEEGRRVFNALSGKERADEYRKALTSGGIADLAKAQGQTFAGVTSTLKDNLQIAAGKIGLPLFQAMTKEVKSWNVWIDANGAAIAEFSQKAAQGLSQAFKMAKEAGAFLVQHKGLLLALAKAWLAGKAVKAMTGGIVDAVKAVQGLASGAAGGLSGLASKASLAASALALIAAAAVAIAELVDQAQERSIDKDVRRAAFGNLLNETHGGQRSRRFAYEEAKRLGYLKTDKDGRVIGLNANAPLQMSARGGGSYVTGEGKSLPFDVVAQMLEGGRLAEDAYQAQRAASRAMAELNAKIPLLNLWGRDPAEKTANNKDINVTIRNVEVATDDPDRFVMGIANLAEDAIRNPSAARGSFRY